jgi:SAM-dependent methyltransferase
MATLEQTWGQERLVAAAYDFAVQNPLVGRAGALALWGFDIALLLESIGRLARAAPGTRVLDVPSGGGLAFRALRPGHGLAYTALDFSPVMLERAGRKLRERGLDGVEFRQGDVGALPFAAGSFDLCISYNGIHCFPDPRRAVAEMARVLAPGGLLRGSMVVRAAGWRFDRVIRRFQRLGWFGPGLTQVELLKALEDNGLVVQEATASGGFLLFEARRREQPVPA